MLGIGAGCERPIQSALRYAPAPSLHAESAPAPLRSNRFPLRSHALFGADYVKVVEDTPVLTVAEM